MELIIVLGFYTSISFGVCWLYTRFGFKRFIITTHLVTLLITLCIPSLFIEFNNWRFPQDPGEVNCGQEEVVLNEVNMFIMIPFSQLMVFLFNRKFDNEYFPSK